MKVLVLGSGVIGVTSAWYLAKSGHDVTVVDRQPSVANETSFANAGQISPGYSAPWAAPGIPAKAIKWLMQELAPLKISTRDLDMETLLWMTKMVANCNSKDYHINKSRMMRVAEYSRNCLRDLRSEINIEYEHRTQGTLQLFRTESQVKSSKKDIQVLNECGVDHQILTPDECLAYEPALKHTINKVVGGIRLPNDETGNCHMFVTELAKECEKLGVKFVMNTDIKKLNKQGDEITSVTTDKGEFTADAYLMALGSYSTHMLADIGIKVPVYPVKGYSLTIPIEDYSAAPESTIMDETYKVAITRLGDQIRVGGTAEITSYNLALTEKRRKNIEFSVADLFPHAADLAKADFWTGLRPMTPDGTPILGKTNIDNLFLNTGHGTLGWTMSLGSAKFISDIISCKPPDIDDSGLSIARYAH
ncbi:D-amino acid dehydrogenase [Pseudocolwellia sp. AS88]|uniref:D-amino acid dehydrogenase n=1 Tax=Pseudocolwellia sp. AS88 TaxID=3063958 RepID=UPI0026EDD57C|nr:D-amino acid dehydrogenase [Pseudocolwellia sp. AS88]MDO7086413.1 D-amino acid dehydrogenase [Pseudocolwellia sp. AS88]